MKEEVENVGGGRRLRGGSKTIKNIDNNANTQHLDNDPHFASSINHLIKNDYNGSKFA